MHRVRSTAERSSQLIRTLPRHEQLVKTKLLQKIFRCDRSAFRLSWSFTKSALNLTPGICLKIANHSTGEVKIQLHQRLLFGSADLVKFSAMAGASFVTLETLHFDNVALKVLPIDKEEENFLREVAGACFSRVKPAPVKRPRLVATSRSAMALLGLNEKEILRPEFVDYFSGNQLLPGSETAAHCYCGHQFGYFAGQLGDGAAIYLGEVVNESNERWEVQLKGAGLTPFSRQADGRKVLRSSIREFLCSEAMHYLGIPTTRAGCCITSDSTVSRDIFYTGKPITEYCTVVTRIAETFIRFGSFEVCKGPDRESGREGPSCTRPDVIQTLTDYVIKQFYPALWNSEEASSQQMYIEFFRDVVKKTASLVASWQCVGFCHGVLNTDNMSIVGLTIDYGPFGFMDRFNPNHICNTSDDGGRYAYNKQPEICKWNCLKLAEMLQKVVGGMEQLREVLEEYDGHYEKFYMERMRNKFGLLHVQDPVADKKLIDLFLDSMHQTGADFTNSFRCLSRLSLPSCADHDRSCEEVIEYLLTQCATLDELKASYAPKMDPREFAMMSSLMETNRQLLMSFGKGYRMLAIEQRNMEKLKELESETEDDRRSKNRVAWKKWLDMYIARLQREIVNVDNVQAANDERIRVMNSSNPWIVLRNYIAQNAIDAAEKGDYSEVQNVLRLLEKPFSDEQDASRNLEQNLNPNIKYQQESLCSASRRQKYCGKPPIWASSLKVSCSS